MVCFRRYVKTQPTMQSTKKPVNKRGSGVKEKQPRTKDYFTMCLVNGYGSQVLRNLSDDDTKLTLNG